MIGRTLVLLFAALSAMHAETGNPPDLLTMQDGTKVTTIEAWQKERRPEILKLFREHIYGRNPVERPEKLSFVVKTTEGMMDGAAIRRQVTIRFKGPHGEGAINLLLFVPAKADRPVPCLLLVGNRPADSIDADRLTRNEFWPAESLVARGYAAAVFLVSDVAADTYSSFSTGVHQIFGDREHGPDAWGTIAAWAWGASRAMDYLETDPDIDAKRIAIVGHSRGGKTALWAGATDDRFAFVVSNNSGCTGAALSRGKRGETVKIINDSFPYWFCQNYKRYNDRENELPVDQHMLIALVAPRPVYVASATEDKWSDPEAEFRACVEATPAYQLFGLPGLESSSRPQPNSPLLKGQIGYHIRAGKHDLIKYDWTCFADFFDEHMSPR
jgi:dienelactone hydrolase